ncbi:Protein kinase domain [Macleaya cordata]|uniref:non-specific serine/threonine protein kinase n=1 Tax=Macleaya cordata TaxID=56857 RepID=A0A200R5Q7_MACCD|nr:Protein kinase domain [Macleaya cordata]
MKIKSEVALACIIILLSFQYNSCDGVPEGSGMNKWTCSCDSAKDGNETYSVAANCSTFCDCNPEAAVGSSGDRWTCLCAEGFPKAPGNFHDSSCFADCNCTAGIPGEPKASRKRISSKVVVYILLLSVVLTTLAFLASLGCYVYRRDRYPIQPPIFSSDKDTSCNSATNLISHGSTSVSSFKVDTNSPVKPIAGCIRNVSFMFRSKRGTLPGTIFQFSYTELELATNKFDKSNLIGLGGSSHVYRGQLKDGRTVAVKRLKTPGGPDADNVFLTEIELISRLHHCHVIPLLGYCSESQGKHAERLLVFEYMPNGNLRDCLDEVQGKEPMDWGTRIGIALGAARGLEYLHEAAAPRILHRDVKSTNILLDDKWRAKITDLGMAKHLRTDDLPSAPSSPARMQGTFGYFAPEYAIVGRASLKSDVFSFGVVLLELISGRQPIHKSSDKGEESLVIWAAPRLKDSKRVISELADPLLKGNYPEEEMQVMAYLAKECLLLDPDSRPTMSEVVQILSTISPDKSRRRSFPVSLFQSSSTRSMRTVVEMERHGEQAEGSIIAEELNRTTSERWSPRCSLPLTSDQTLCVKDDTKKGEVALSAEYMERLILLTSKARSWRAHPDDEIVDLTEPRFESFLQANVHSI